MSTLHLLWDESYLWGLLLVRGIRALGLPCTLVRGKDIAAGLLQQSPPAMLLVPGGNARHKAAALGAKGLEAIRSYVKAGGQYLGFCGGAGLALTGEQGLGLCPWRRAGYDDRLQHFLSGHLHMDLPPSVPATSQLFPAHFPPSPLLPVWWPGRFEANPVAGVDVLATYAQPSDDFWLADLPVKSLPEDIFADWENLYGFSASPTFLTGQPCLIQGEYGKGGYILSYSHLETPDSAHANIWLAHLVRTLTALTPLGEHIPDWDIQAASPIWDDTGLTHLQSLLDKVCNTGLEHGLLFARNGWLLGWRAGIPGANINNLRATLQVVRQTHPTRAALCIWQKCKQSLLEAAGFFHKGVLSYLLAERLALTLSKSLPTALPPALLQKQKNSLFGPPMQAGGLYRDLMLPLDELAYATLKAE